jgi:hypothetical protein
VDAISIAPVPWAQALPRVGLNHLLFDEEHLVLMKNHLVQEDLLFYVMNLDRLACAVKRRQVCLNVAVSQPSDLPPTYLENSSSLFKFKLSTSLL